MDSPQRQRWITDDSLLRFEQSVIRDTRLIQEQLSLALQEGDRIALREAMAIGCRAVNSVLANPTFDQALLDLHRSAGVRSDVARRTRQRVDEVLQGSFDQFLQLEFQVLRVSGMTDGEVRQQLRACREAVQSGLTTRIAMDAENDEDYCRRVRAVVEHLGDQVCAQENGLRLSVPGSTTEENSSNLVESSINLGTSLQGMLGGCIILGLNFGPSALIAGFSPVAINLSGSSGFDRIVSNAATAARVPLRALIVWIRDGQLAEGNGMYLEDQQQRAIHEYWLDVERRVEQQRLDARSVIR